jgi:hypothetical protein
MLTAAQYQEKHARRLKASIPDITTGVAAVTVAPGGLAAAKQAKMIDRLTASVTSGKWAAKVSAVTLADWKTATTNKGIPRISGGIDGAAAKVTAFATRLLPFETTLQSTVNALPDVTLEDSIARMTAWVRGMAQFPG